VIAALHERGLWSADAHSDHPADWGVITRAWDYHDPHGNQLFQVCRFEPKSFRPRRPDGRGGWRWGYGDVQRILYRLPDVLRSPIVFVCEGERDADTVRKFGFVATTAPGGCKAPWLPQYTEALRGREVIIVPDMDECGLARGSEIASAMLGSASSIVLFRKGDLGTFKDITEWFDAGHSECELIALIEGSHAI
jgi:putative DNA primase/helicase